MSEGSLPGGTVEKLGLGMAGQLLKRCVRKAFTGRLIFRNGPLSCSFFFSEGYIVHGRTNRQELRLGEIFKEECGLDDKAIEQALAVARSKGEMLGVSLLRSGVIGPRDLYRCLVRQVELMVDDVAAWGGGVCHVSPDITPGEGVVLLRVSPLRERLPEPSPPKPQEGPVPALHRAPSPAPRGASPTPTPTPTPTKAAEPPPAGAALQSVNDFIREKETVREGDHYGILGVKSGATPEDIRGAWQQLIRTWHPDRVAHRLLESDLLKLHTIFARINAAQAVLGDPARRRAYDRERKEQVGGGPEWRKSDPGEEASRLFRSARALIRDESFSQAVEYLKKACQLQPDKPAYHYYLGGALFKAKRHKAAEEAMLRAIELDGTNPDYLVALGQVYREGRLPGKAADCFDRALKLDHRHPQALKEKRALRDERRD